MYKLNSLVDLIFVRKGFEGLLCKRWSLLFYYEGYLWLKNSNRDLVYEDEEEMIEYNICKIFMMNYLKLVIFKYVLVL